ncbi:MAG: FAD:protein FMN transferase [Myxococcota bacterium]
MAPPGPKSRSLINYILPVLFVGALFVMLWQRRPQAPGSTPNRTLTTFQGEIFGTTYAVKIVTPKTPSETHRADLEAAMKAAMDNVNDKMSTWQPDSEISRFNAHDSTAPFPVSSETLAVIQAAHEVSVASGGGFDVTVRPLVSAWKFGDDAAEQTPTKADLALIMGQIGYQKLTTDMENMTLTKAIPELTVDLSAIAKGYGVDEVARALEAKGIEEYLVEIGGEVRAKGRNPDNATWKIGVEKPDAIRGVIVEVVSLDGISMATSGDYRNYYEEDGKRISHTIDARTGQPIDHTLASVSVLHQSCAMADAYATAINVLGPEEGMALAQDRDLAVLMLVRSASGDFEARATPGFEAARVMNEEAEQGQNP